jgi:hypothetical protein
MSKKWGFGDQLGLFGEPESAPVKKSDRKITPIKSDLKVTSARVGLPWEAPEPEVLAECHPEECHRPVTSCEAPSPVVGSRTCDLCGRDVKVNVWYMHVGTDLIEPFCKVLRAEMREARFQRWNAWASVHAPDRVWTRLSS